MIDKLTTAILESRKVRLLLVDGREKVVHPHIVIRNREGSKILKAMLDDGNCSDIAFQDIRAVTILSQSFAIDSQCLSFDYEEYELVFPKKEDWFHFKADFA